MTEKLEKLAKLAAALPKEVKDNALALVTRMGTTIEGLGDTPIAWRAPMIKMVQPTTDRSKLPKTANIGSLVLEDKVVEQPFRVIALRVWDSRQYWSPDKDEARMLCNSPDAKFGYINRFCKDCEHGKFDETTNRSACNKSKSMILASADLGNVFTINFTKTNFAGGRDWVTLMKKAGVAPYKKVYEMKTGANAKFKQVEAITVETKNENTPTGYLPFLEELFIQAGADREAYVASFYELVKSKNQGQPALLESNTETNIQGIESKVTEEQTSMSKGYSM